MLRKPRPLQPGDRVRLVAPSGIADRARGEFGTRVLEGWGLVVEAPASLPRRRYLAGSDAERGAALEDALNDHDAAAVLCVRGGYGTARLAPALDLSGIGARPKIFVGYSDITLLLDRLVREQGTVAFHGPMVASDLPRMSETALERFRRFLFGEEGWWDGSCRGSWLPGHSRGRLVGGCLSVLVTTLGTPWEIDTDGAVLFLEDIDERPYRIDRMLVQLAQAGKLERLAALVLGSFLSCGPEAGESTDEAELREIVLEALAGRRIPVLHGLDAGHGSSHVVLPMGCEVDVDCGKLRVTPCEKVLG